MSVSTTSPLVTTEWLAEHLADPGVIVAEVDENPELYEEGHIPGAVKLDWRDDLQDPLVRDVVSSTAFEQLMGERGIGNDTTVVLYGDKNNWFAAYAYWYLKVFRHEDVRLLDGGRQKWIEEGRDLTAAVSTPGPVAYTAQDRDESIRIRRDEVLGGLGGPGIALVDVRSPQEFAGELVAPPGYEQEGASRTGHIPGAQSIPWATAVRDDGTFKALDELREIYAAKGITPDKEIRAYCRIGERSAHTWFVLRELLGYENVRNYDGSWTEWGNLVDVPIER
ncbi:MAG: thiosulfate sulfurtransferase [Actinobacteria bacterium RBG_16_67_10]|nr:MAG: thiosulfate sulfurtransferase [Actinobacteria bacterium RBG_16_67_10]